MPTLSIEFAEGNLSELIRKLPPGEELLLTENGRVVARIVITRAAEAVRQLGTLRGTVLRMAPDFDAPLDDFEDYMP